MQGPQNFPCKLHAFCVFQFVWLLNFLPGYLSPKLLQESLANSEVSKAAAHHFQQPFVRDSSLAVAILLHTKRVERDWLKHDSIALSLFIIGLANTSKVSFFSKSSRETVIYHLLRPGGQEPWLSVQMLGSDGPKLCEFGRVTTSLWSQFYHL